MSFNLRDIQNHSGILSIISTWKSQKNKLKQTFFREESEIFSLEESRIFKKLILEKRKNSSSSLFLNKNLSTDFKTFFGFF